MFPLHETRTIPVVDPGRPTASSACSGWSSRCPLWAPLVLLVGSP